MPYGVWLPHFEQAGDISLTNSAHLLTSHFFVFQYRISNFAALLRQFHPIPIQSLAQHAYWFVASPAHFPHGLASIALLFPLNLWPFSNGFVYRISSITLIFNAIDLI
jgi:hypothetical protein